MKIKNYISLVLIILVVGACKKDPVTRPVDFSSTTYQPLGTFDASGTPTYLLPKDVISPGMQNFIQSILIEQTDLRTTHPELLGSAAIADIAITTPSDVFITYVSQITNATNALAFYTYPANNPPASSKDIKTITYAFPSIGAGTKLKAGDKVKIGRFTAGTSIGFVVLKGAWNAATSTLDNSVVHFCSNDVLNPEVDPSLKRHAVLVNYAAESKVLVGFENTDRTVATCDHDFNDVVIYVTVTP
ncbi:MAG: DUF4114 domain-containing protein [Ginsengibacter sp.]